MPNSRMAFPICYYSSRTDYVITGRLLRGKYFEAGEVNRVLQLVRLDRRLQL